MATPKEILILKLGGSIVTRKQASAPALRRRHVQDIAHILKRYYNPNQHHLVLIHGAGSFGHLHAHRHHLSLGTKDHPEKLFRAVEEQSLDAKLNNELTLLFIQAGLPVVGMPTRSFATNKKGGLHSLETPSLALALSQGAIPLLHGDMVFDHTWGLSILSGDVLIARLAQQLHADKVFFASDVDGVFSEDPHRSKKARLIPQLSLSSLNKMASLTSSHNKDVTGGLAKKFSYFEKNSFPKQIYFFNGLRAKNFSFVFTQKNFFGTVIKND